MATVSLDPMDAATYEAWRDRAVHEYAAEHVRTGNWTAEEAPERSAEAFESILTAGRETEGQFLWTVRDGSGGDVGILWVGTERRPGQAYIYDIEIDPHRRGEGLGTAAMLALEAWARARGMSVIALHVFGHNTGAWQLYKRLGFVETNVNMEKRL